MYPGHRVVKMPNSATSCPIIGIGGWAPNFGEERTTKAKKWFLSALKNGYRHIDTAYSYGLGETIFVDSWINTRTGTEKAVGEAIIESGIPREDIFVVSKLPSHHHGRVLESIQESLDNLGFKWLDMYLMHWPFSAPYELEGEEPRPLPTIAETWAGMEEALRRSKCEAIGVSNFSIKTLEEVMKNKRVKPAMNQVEMHPYLQQNDLLEFCRKHDIAVVAYNPSGTDIVRKDPVIVELAAKYNVTPTQIILAWHLSRNVVVIPKSTNEERQKENHNLPTLEEEDLKKINALDRGQRICNKGDENGLVYGMSIEDLGW
ncbi:Aldo-keto reductase [Mycena sanguinolenta]|uniref:Aldo-keto reductase n=1 Tax=Mycena sanguinolenta TaxID=230812 RepID=A0A8H6ZC25_9AGAR|nr:Aldo-keto reductase [Mycena sanguinolenta]